MELLMNLTARIGKSLDGFTVQRLTEVYSTNEDGKKVKSKGFFKNGSIAQAFAANQSGGDAYNKTSKHFVLTDGKEGFLIGEVVILLDDEQVALDIRTAAMAKLSDAERAALKL